MTRKHFLVDKNRDPIILLKYKDKAKESLESHCKTVSGVTWTDIKFQEFTKKIM
jgi:hypothetical protein